MVNRPHSTVVSHIALPVWDHPLDHSRLNPIRSDFGQRMQQLTYAAVCSANGQNPHPPPSSKTLTNKHTFRSVRPGSIDSSHPAALGTSRPSLEFLIENGNGGTVMHLGLPTQEEGLADVTGSHSPAFDDVLKSMCRRPELGGNIPNSGLNQVRMFALLSEIDPALQLHILTPSQELEEIILEQRERIGGALSVHRLDDLEVRKGLHIDIHFLHEPIGDRAYNGVTAMFNSRGPSVEEVQHALLPHAELLRNSTLFTPDPRLIHRQSARLIPTTAAMKEIDLAQGHGLFMNESELRALCLRLGLLESDAPPEWLPSPVANGHMSTERIGEASKRLRTISRQMSPTGSGKRLLQTGLVDGSLYDMFDGENGADIVYISAMSDEAEDRVIRIVDSPSVGRHLENKTGRGDAASAASLIDLVPPGKILEWWNEHRPEMRTQLNPEQQVIFGRLLASVMSRFHSKIVFYCQDPNFLHAVDDGAYRRIFSEGVRIALKMAQQYRSDVQGEPQLLPDHEWGVSTVVWTAK